MPKAATNIPISRAQARFLSSAAQTVVLQGGAGCGKTFAGALKVASRCLERPGIKSMYVSNSYPQLAQAFVPHLETVLRMLGVEQRTRWNRSENHLTFTNEAQLWLRSADRPDSLFGADLGDGNADEVGLWRRRSWDIMQGRLRQPGHQHQLSVTYTPKGRYHWSFSELSASKPGIEVIHATSMQNPFIGEDHVERMRASYVEGSNLWRQEVLGEFVTWEGLVYHEFNDDRHVAQIPDTDENGQPIRWARVVAGVDWGWTNPGVIVIGALDADGILWVVDEVYERERSIGWWVERARELATRWGVRQWNCDPSEPGNIAAMRQAGLNATKGNNRVVPGIMAVASRFGADTIVIGEHCGKLRQELGSYCWATDVNGEPRGDTPEKINDHACDALRYLVMGLTTGGLRARKAA